MSENLLEVTLKNIISQHFVTSKFILKKVFFQYDTNVKVINKRESSYTLLYLETVMKSKMYKKTCDVYIHVLEACIIFYIHMHTRAQVDKNYLIYPYIL